MFRRRWALPGPRSGSSCVLPTNPAGIWPARGRRGAPSLTKQLKGTPKSPCRGTDEGGGCSRAVPVAEKGAGAQGRKREARRGRGASGWAQPPDPGTELSPLGLPRGDPVSQWRGLAVRLRAVCPPACCPAAWTQSLSITNAANNSQQAPAPRACAPQPKHTARAGCGQHPAQVCEPPHYSLPPFGARSSPRRHAEGSDPLGWSPSPWHRAEPQRSWAGAKPHAPSTAAGSPFYF